jgi:hypothetical protein
MGVNAQKFGRPGGGFVAEVIRAAAVAFCGAVTERGELLAPGLRFLRRCAEITRHRWETRFGFRFHAQGFRLAPRPATAGKRGQTAGKVGKIHNAGCGAHAVGERAAAEHDLIMSTL